MSELAAKIEAFLFARGEPIQITALSKVFGLPSEEIERALRELEETYLSSKRGIILIRGNEGVALGTRPDFGEFLKKAFGEELHQELTPAALETLAIVAYRGPISRPEVDAIRGVNSTFMLRNLMLRGLISRSQEPGRHNVWLYEITIECMKMLGISKKEELPDFETLSQSLDKLQLYEKDQHLS